MRKVLFSIIILALLGMTVGLGQDIKRDPRYPAHWWTPIIDPKKPDWEIMPQEAGPGEVILSKRHELGLLSNFAPTPFVFHGKRYASLEGFWQMMKYPEGPDDPRAQFPEKHFVGLVLLPGPREINSLAIDEGKLATRDGRTDAAGDGGEHDERREVYTKRERGRRS